MSRVRRFVSTYGLDALVVVAALSGAVSTALRDDEHRLTGPAGWFEVVAIAATVLGLLLRRRYAFGAPAGLFLAAAALSFVDGRLVSSQPGIFIAGLGAALLLGNLRDERQTRIGLAIVVVSAAIIVSNDPSQTPDDIFFTPMQFALAWLVGYALRERTERTLAAEERASRAERDRETAARLAVAEERARIARELHDIVAHAMSVMVLQVGAVRHRMPEGDTANAEALKNVEHAGRTALAEMRRLLGAMRHADDQPELLPHPGLGDLPRLLDDVRAAGLGVELRTQGDPVELPPGLDLSAYRIVQEGLTNTLKHARARHAIVEVGYGPEAVTVAVRDDGRGSSSGGPGHGLVGIAERVKIYGGDLAAGPSPDGGHLLRARLPLDGDAP